MTLAEKLDSLCQDCKHYPCYALKNDDMCMQKRDIKSALEKQTPKKPKITAFGVECSNCGSIVDFGSNVARLNGCPWCLQVIDWSEEE